MRDSYIYEEDIRPLRRHDSLATLDGVGTREDSVRAMTRQKKTYFQTCLAFRALIFVSCSISLYFHMAQFWLRILTDTQPSC